MLDLLHICTTDKVHLEEHSGPWSWSGSLLGFSARDFLPSPELFLPRVNLQLEGCFTNGLNDLLGLGS